MSAKPEQVTANRWIEEHQDKLRQYADALKRKDTGDYFDAGDFLSVMCMKIMTNASYIEGFMSREDAYIFRSAWNAGIDMIREQRRYEMKISVSAGQIVEDDQDASDPMEFVSGPESDNPENATIVGTESELIASAIASLPPISRKICVELYAGKRPVDIAREMGFRSRSAVNYHIGIIQQVFSSFGLSAI